MTLRATILDVGQGDSLILDMPNGHFGLVDFGTASAGAAVVAPAVAARLANGATFLFAVATHCDADHVGGAAAVLAVARPKYVLESPVPLDLFEEYAKACKDPSAIAGVAALKAKGQARMRPAVQQTVRFKEEPEVTMVPLSPDSHVEDQLREFLMSGRPITDLASSLAGLRNRSSLVLYIRHGESGLVLLGEADDSQFDNIWNVVADRMAEPYKKPGLVKLSHHGSINNNPPELFARFGERGTLMGVSAGGRYGHPDVVVMDRVRRAGATPACTNLGRGCQLLIGSPLPVDLPAWKETVKTSLTSNPSAGCHGEVAVECHDNGAFSAVFATSQPRCPFGAATGTTWTRPL